MIYETWRRGAIFPTADDAQRYLWQQWFEAENHVAQAEAKLRKAADALSAGHAAQPDVEAVIKTITADYLNECDLSRSQRIAVSEFSDTLLSELALRAQRGEGEKG